MHVKVNGQIVRPECINGYFDLSGIMEATGVHPREWLEDYAPPMYTVRNTGVKYWAKQSQVYLFAAFCCTYFRCVAREANGFADAGDLAHARERASLIAGGLIHR
jgi:hypothetical protein